MTHLRRRWGAQQWGGRMLAVAAVIVSLIAASALVLASTTPPRLSARGTPLPLPATSSPAPPAATPTAPTAAPTAPATAPATGPSAPTTLSSVGSDELAAVTSTAAATSTLGGAWVQIPVPSGASGLVLDRADAHILASGGATVRTTNDGGQHWSATRARPAPTGPFVPLLISPWDSRVLFVSHQGRVAVTTDGGRTWHDVGVPAGGQPVIAAGDSPGTFFAASGGSVVELTNNGASIDHRPPLPAGATATSLAVGRYLLVVCCAGNHPLILKGTKWTAAPITAAGPLAVHGSDIWAAGPGGAPEPVEESSNGGLSWQSRPGLPSGRVVLSLALSSDGRTVYALTNAGEIYESQKGIWYLLSTGLQLGRSTG